jgi:murein DD-endopeptidase MepM/ murein hydrolase activator NlpD
LKDSLTKQVKSVPSCLAYSTEATNQLSAKAFVDVIPIEEKYRQVRKSAATIGLAISMGAVGLLSLNPNDAAVAAESFASDSTITSLPSSQEDNRHLSRIETSKPSALTYVKLAPLATKHEVKPGESLWQLSKEYQVAPEAIATTNNLSSQANLLVGQTLKIPSQQERKYSLKNREYSQKIASRSSSVSPQQLKESLSNLRETRKRLQESLAALKFEETKIQNESDFLPSASAKSLSVDKNSTLLPQTMALSPDRERLESSNETKLDRPIAIAVGEGENLSISKLETEPKESVSKIDSSRSLPIPYPDTASLPQEFRHPELPELEMSLPEAEPEVATPKNEPAKAVEQVYQVKRGDTLNKIAHRHGVSISKLIQANKITNPNVIAVAQQLVIPNTNQVEPTATNPTVITGVPLANNSSTPSIPVITASASPVPLGIAPANTASEESTKVKPSSNAIKLSVDSPISTRAEKLIADISRLQQEYPNRSRSIPISEQSEQANSVPSNLSSETVNPEWSRTRIPTESRANIQIQRAAQPRVPGPRFVRTSNSQNSQQNRTQLVGAAPTDSQEYNNMMRVPVGTAVGPELPPLSVPDEYLPDAPMKFTGYIWPAKGVLTSGYGWRWGRMHKGVDIAAPIGTPIMAAAAGEVISAGWNSGGYGNLVKLKHANGSVTLYAHNSRVLVRTGQRVEQGELIAEMGSTGFSTGPHLHFEVHPGGQGAVNPMAFLPKKRS